MNGFHELPPNFVTDLSALLSSLATDAQMALDDRWNPSGEGSEGFTAQIDLIKDFSKKWRIPIIESDE